MENEILKIVNGYCITALKHDIIESDKPNGFADVGMKHPIKISQSELQHLIVIEIKYSFDGLFYIGKYTFLVNNIENIFHSINNEMFVKLREFFLKKIFDGIIIYAKTLLKLNEEPFSTLSNREFYLMAKNLSVNLQ